MLLGVSVAITTMLRRAIKLALSVQSMAALDAEAVTAQVVMSARRADEAARRVGLQPALVFTPVPDAVFGPEHPTPALAVKDREIPYGEPERSR